jgi:hypothetical protein
MSTDLLRSASFYSRDSNRHTVYPRFARKVDRILKIAVRRGRAQGEIFPLRKRMCVIGGRDGPAASAAAIKIN